MTNVRIARKVRTVEGALIRTEILGEWFHPPTPLDYIRRQLADARTEEPHAGWTLETRGIETAWHEWQD